MLCIVDGYWVWLNRASVSEDESLTHRPDPRASLPDECGSSHNTPRLLFIQGRDPQMYAVTTTLNVPPHSLTKGLVVSICCFGCSNTSDDDEQGVSVNPYLCECACVRVCLRTREKKESGRGKVSGVGGTGAAQG